MQCELEKVEKDKVENYEKWKNIEITEIEYIENIKNIVSKECLLKNTIKDEKSKLFKSKKKKQYILRENVWIDTLLKYKNQRKLTKEMLEDLIDKIYINKDGRKIKIKFKYEDAYKTSNGLFKNCKDGRKYRCLDKVNLKIKKTEGIKKLYNAALYIRLSVEDGDKEESNSITNQRLLLTEFLKENSDIELYDYYIDDGFSGTDFSRPGFERLIRRLIFKEV